jgi:hypothetical protein
MVSQTFLLIFNLPNYHYLHKQILVSFPAQTDEIGKYKKDYNINAMPYIYTTVKDQNISSVFVLTIMKSAVFYHVHFYLKTVF